MNFPIPTTRAELLAMLDEIRAGVESGDTLEGFIEFGLAYEQDAPDFMVLARYRVGNLNGQGGLRSWGEMEAPAPPSVPPTRDDLFTDG